MYRKRRRNIFIDDINLDSLMDILTCLVGIMLLVVIFAVIEARGVNVRMHMPMVKDPPENSERKICICRDGRVKLFEIKDARKELSRHNLTPSFENAPKIVRDANSRNITDQYFKYKLGYDEWTEYGRIYRSIFMIVDERGDVRGDTLEELEESSSRLVKLLAKLDTRKHWIAFMVDKESLEVFKKTREICIKRGLATGWDPGFIKFPYTERGRDRVKIPFSPRGELSNTQ